MTDTGKKDVTYLDEVIKTIRSKLYEAGTVAKTKVLPGARGKLMKPMLEANALLKSVTEVLERSGMGKRLGFIKTEDGIQPVIDPEDEPKGA